MVTICALSKSRSAVRDRSERRPEPANGTRPRKTAKERAILVLSLMAIRRSSAYPSRLVTCVRGSEQNLADLLDVIGIVARHMSDQIPDRDPATLGMNPKALPLLRRELLQEL